MVDRIKRLRIRTGISWFIKNHSFALSCAGLIENSNLGKWQRTVPAEPLASMTLSVRFNATRRPVVGILAERESMSLERPENEAKLTIIGRLNINDVTQLYAETFTVCCIETKLILVFMW